MLQQQQKPSFWLDPNTPNTNTQFHWTRIKQHEKKWRQLGWIWPRIVCLVLLALIVLSGSLCEMWCFFSLVKKTIFGKILQFWATFGFLDLYKVRLRKKKFHSMKLMIGFYPKCIIWHVNIRIKNLLDLLSIIFIIQNHIIIINNNIIITFIRRPFNIIIIL